MTEGLFGIRPIALDAFVMTPQLPEKLEIMMSLKRVCAFGSIFDIEVKRDKDNKLSVLIKKDHKIVKRSKIMNGKPIEVRI